MKNNYGFKIEDNDKIQNEEDLKNFFMSMKKNDFISIWEYNIRMFVSSVFTLCQDEELKKTGIKIKEYKEELKAIEMNIISMVEFSSVITNINGGIKTEIIDSKNLLCEVCENSNDVASKNCIFTIKKNEKHFFRFDRNIFLIIVLGAIRKLLYRKASSVEMSCYGEDDKVIFSFEMKGIQEDFDYTSDNDLWDRCFLPMSSFIAERTDVKIEEKENVFYISVPKSEDSHDFKEKTSTKRIEDSNFSEYKIMLTGINC